MAKLTNADIEHIFRLRDEGLSLRQIAYKMECGKSTVNKILRGEIRGQAIEQMTYSSAVHS